jgi:predicted double-glycine peptidase
MLIMDFLPDAIDDPNYSEAVLRAIFQTDEQGSIIARIPEVLQTSGVKKSFVNKMDLTFEQLREYLKREVAIAVLRAPGNIHVVIVEQVTASAVAMRDPLPPGRGSAYEVALTDFLAVWEKSGQGSAVVIES